MSIRNEISDLLRAEVINQDTADRIGQYYQSKEGDSSSRLFIAFGIIGAILVGMGIILIIGHNWDELSRGIKTVLAFVPLGLSQLICGYALYKKRDSTAWRETSSVLLFFAVAASIALVSQVYNIPGDLSSFLLTWMLLVLPLIYLMNSSITSLLCIIFITYYASILNYWHPREESHWFWLLLLAVVPHYYLLFKEKSNSNFIKFHHWLIPLSLVVVLGAVSDNAGDLMWVAYMSLFGLLCLVGMQDHFAGKKLRNNGYKVIGTLGSLGLLLTTSFNWFWSDIKRSNLSIMDAVFSAEFIAVSIISLMALFFLISYLKDKFLAQVKPIAFAFVLFMFAYVLGHFGIIGAVLVNLYIFTIGVLTIKEGGDKNHLGILNFGLIIIAALVACRFFDTDMSFVWRGILFVLVGLGFFATNYWMLKKRKENG